MSIRKLNPQLISNHSLGNLKYYFIKINETVDSVNELSQSVKTKYKETFTYNGIALTLANTCSFMYSLNWGNLALNEGVDYSFSGTTLTILNSNINNGDLLYAIYE